MKTLFALILVSAAFAQTNESMWRGVPYGTVDTVAIPMIDSVLNASGVREKSEYLVPGKFYDFPCTYSFVFGGDRHTLGVVAVRFEADVSANVDFFLDVPRLLVDKYGADTTWSRDEINQSRTVYWLHYQGAPQITYFLSGCEISYINQKAVERWKYPDVIHPQGAVQKSDY